MLSEEKIREIMDDMAGGNPDRYFSYTSTTIELADALEEAERRIAELEIIVSGQQMLGYLPKGMVPGSVCGLSAEELIKRIRFADVAERKLAVAREALACIASWARTQYKAQGKGGHATFDMMTLKGQVAAIEEALAQIGGEDGN